jgi:hypothetical protein
VKRKRARAQGTARLGALLKLKALCEDENIEMDLLEFLFLITLDYLFGIYVGAVHLIPYCEFSTWTTWLEVFILELCWG